MMKLMRKRDPVETSMFHCNFLRNLLKFFEKSFFTFKRQFLTLKRNILLSKAGYKTKIGVTNF